MKKREREKKRRLAELKADADYSAEQRRRGRVRMIARLEADLSDSA